MTGSTVQLLFRDLCEVKAVISNKTHKSCLCVMHGWQMLSGFLQSHATLKRWHLAPVLCLLFVVLCFMQEKCGETSVDVRPVYRPHTITTVILCDAWCWKFLWGQKVDYFHGCGNNRIGRKLLWVSYRPRRVMAFLHCSRRLFIRPFCHQLSKKCFHVI